MRNLLLGTYSAFCIMGIILVLVFIPKYTPEYMGFGLPSSFLPYALACCIVIFSCIEFIKTYRNKEDKRPSSIDSHNLLHLAKVSTIAFLTFPLMDLISFIPGAIISLCVFQFLCGQRDYKMMAAISVGLSVAIYLIATYLLAIPLP